MNNKIKIALWAGVAISIGIGGYILYRKVVKQNEAARVYLNGVDDENSSIVGINSELDKSKLALRKV